MKHLIKIIFKFLGVSVLRYDDLSSLRSYEKDIDTLIKENSSNLKSVFKFYRYSKSQLKQDLFVIHELGAKKRGFFVEFGATNGVNLSNTFLLEKKLGWKGILVEPAKCWHKELKKNRAAFIETRCVWKKSNAKIVFSEETTQEHSKISNNFLFNSKALKTYQLETISLIDLLKKYNAPKVIDYLSIDTEGSEYEILRNFNFNLFQFRIITCEHNFGPNREKIHALLNKYGYKRKFKGISRWDDWYTKETNKE